MRLSISRNAAFSAAFVAAVTRVFLNLSLDGDAPHNGIWIAALLGAVPAIPYLLCLDAVRKSSTGVTPIRKALMLILLLITALDAARVLSIFTRASGYLALEFVSPLWLTLPVALAILWCTWRNGDAVGYAAMLWTKVFPALMLVVILLQLRHYHAEWLRPLLGNGWRDIARDGIRTSGCLVPVTAIMLACDDRGALKESRPAIGWVAAACLVAALLLVLRLMMAPAGKYGLPWLSRLDALLTNGRAPLYLQLPMIMAFFVSLFHLLTCECFAASALLQRLIPALNGHLCGSIVVIGSAFIALNGFVGTRFVSLAFPISASAVALTALFQPKHKESVYHA